MCSDRIDISYGLPWNFKLLFFLFFLSLPPPPAIPGKRLIFTSVSVSSLIRTRQILVRRSDFFFLFFFSFLLFFSWFGLLHVRPDIHTIYLSVAPVTVFERAP